MTKDSIATCAATFGGLSLILLGILGLWFPSLLGMHLGVVVNLAHLASGAAVLYLGLNSTSLPWLRISCLGLGVAYGLAGLASFLFGGPGNAVTLLSGYLVLPRMDHLFHLFLSAGFLWAGMVQPLGAIIPRAQETK